MNCPILRIGLSGFSSMDHYRLEQYIAQAVDVLGYRAVFIASDDLSHKLKDDGPYGYAPEGPVFDRQVTQAMAERVFSSFCCPGTLQQSASHNNLGPLHTSFSFGMGLCFAGRFDAYPPRPPWVKLARLSLETFVKTRKRLERLPNGLPTEMTEQTAGTFVSLHAHGQLRG